MEAEEVIPNQESFEDDVSSEETDPVDHEELFEGLTSTED